MPPKLKKTRSHHPTSGKDSGNCSFPRVVLQPLMADPSGQYRSHFTCEPPTSCLFNKPEFSDIKLRVGDECYYAHKVVLCAASEVFARMMSNDWSESSVSELVLHEEGDCAKVFDRFLYFFYSGSIVISESYVIPLFSLSDKYDVKPVYDECVKIIEKGLKVYVVDSAPSEDAVSGIIPYRHQEETANKFNQGSASGSSSSEDSSSSEAFDSDDSSSTENPSTSFEATAVVPPMSPSKSSKVLHLIGSETFPISLVIKMMRLWHNQRISTAALYNLEARLGNQITQENYSTWNTLELELVVQMLGDTNFCYGEYVLFRAAKSWLLHSGCRQTEDISGRVLEQIRYPILLPQELYEVEKDSLVKKCVSAQPLLQDAMRYQLFSSCCSDDDKSRWTVRQFQKRKPRFL